MTLTIKQVGHIRALLIVESSNTKKYSLEERSSYEAGVEYLDDLEDIIIGGVE